MINLLLLKSAPHYSRLFIFIKTTFSLYTITLFFLTILANITALLVLFPGKFDPLWPFHNDSYVPVQVSAYSRLQDILLSPRPFFIAFMHLSGFFGIRGSLFLTYLISLFVVFLFAYIWILFTRKSLRDSTFLVFVYLLFLFSHSYWYTWANFDTNSQLSLLLTLLGILFCVQCNYFCAFVFFLSAALSKETFFLVTPLILSAFSLIRSFNILYSIFIYIFCVFISIIHSTFVGSVFTSGVSGSSDSNYTISVGISTLYNLAKYIYVGYSILELYLFGLIMLFSIIFLRSIAHFLFLCLIILLGLLSLVPNAILENHFFGGYSLSSAYFFYACVFMIPFTKKMFSVKNILFLSLIIGILFSRNYSAASWYVIQQDSQRDLLKSLIFECSKLENAKKYILISGLSIPFSPFYYGGGPVQSISGCANSQFDIEQVAIVPSTPSWFRTGVRVTGIQYIYGKVRDISKYDHVWLFDDHKLVLGYAT